VRLERVEKPGFIIRENKERRRTMPEKVKDYFVMLESLSNEDLDRSARQIAVREKHEAARLIAHIAEIGKRRYYLDVGCGSLFEYCVTRLNLSEGSVYRRTQVAAVCRKIPQILEALAAGRLHLTGASLIAAHLTAENAESLIASASGKTRREVEKILVALSPKEAFEPSLRKLPSPPSDLNAAVRIEVRSQLGPPEMPVVPSAGKHPRDLVEPAAEDRYNVRFSAGNEFAEKFRRFAEVLGIECPENHVEEILDQALEIALEKKDPQRKLERRRNREAKKKSQRPRPGDAGEEEKRKQESESPAPTRHIPSEVRERVLERAGYRCEFRGPDGSRCSSRTGLEVEHTRPFAVYRSHDEQYLRIYCPAHNLQAARKFYGEDFIRRKIHAARGALAAGSTT
jgi:hypothetical protein